MLYAANFGMDLSINRSHRVLRVLELNLPSPADVLSGLMPSGDRDLRCLSVEARDQIQLDACRLGLRGPAVQRVEHRRQRRVAKASERVAMRRSRCDKILPRHPAF
jgi:hypothetical protein